MLRKLSEPAALPAPAQLGTDGQPQLAGPDGALMALPNGQRSHQDNLARAQQLAKDDPRVVANIVKTWVSE
jgi:flagellar M-ring protein FliF